jgi:sialic acid synthase SpsE
LQNQGFRVQRAAPRSPRPAEERETKAMISDRNVRTEEKARSPRFVAEVSSNHQCDLARALRFVDRAADIGCDGVKFQLFRIDELFAPEILERSETHRARRNWELPVRFLPAIADRCRERNVEFSCTPFYLDAVALLEPYVDFLKIASYELLWDDLLRLCAQTGLPIVLSTGMATMSEVEHAIDVIARAGGSDLTLLHCVSGYPAPPAEANLAAIDTLAALDARHADLRVRTGWSDHTVQPGVIHRAVHAHASDMIEFHLDLEGEGDEFAGGHCWLPEDMRATIEQVRAGLVAEGNPNKAPTLIESDERAWRADPSDGLRPLRPLRAVWSPAG